MSYTLYSLKEEPTQGNIWGSIVGLINWQLIKGDTRSLDNGSYEARTIFYISVDDPLRRDILATIISMKLSYLQTVASLYQLPRCHDVLKSNLPGHLQPTFFRYLSQIR